MNGAHIFPVVDKGSRPLRHAGLAALIAQATLALVPAMVIREALIAHLHEGLKPWEGPLVRPEMLTPGWFAELAIAFGWAFLCVLPGTLLFIAIVDRMERGEARAAWAWGVAGAVAQIPLAIGLCIFVGTNLHGPADLRLFLFLLLMVAPVPCAIGLCGGIVARRFRHPPGWTDPL